MRSGFTLIELLVVFSIIAILSGIGIASFASYSRSQQVNQSANNIKLLINEARANAQSTVKSATNKSGATISCGASTLIGYNITVVGNTQITLTQICDEVSPPDRTIKTITLPTGVTFKNIVPPATNCTQILFGSLSAVASGVPCSLEIDGANTKKTITVDAIGNVAVN